MASISSDEEADNDSFLNRLNNKIGDALRRTAAAVFGWFVSVFNVLLE
ncbi:hypothetical protein N6H14_22725 [Paenibacillus sp. CC-CFT747]|nr:hypothetical protein N6H14_22725 [Paenibacillus sp. CC-CFT747]